MRWVLGAGVLLALTPSAFAEDFGILRGTEPTYHWGGFYGGAQGGYSSSTINFSQSAASEIGFILRQTTIEQDQQISQWDVLGDRSPTSGSLGGFVGYNVEWEDVILGLELNYNRVSLSASTGSSLTRSFTDSTGLPDGHHYFYTVTVGAESSLHMTDIATFRARAGWEAGNFLPYAFAGMALGRVNISTAVSVAYSATDFVDSSTPPLVPLPDLSFGPSALSNGQNGTIAYGFATGIGTDIALFPNVFVRGELEYIYFAPVDHIQVTVASARVGVGFKF